MLTPEQRKEIVRQCDNPRQSWVVIHRDQAQALLAELKEAEQQRGGWKDACAESQKATEQARGFCEDAERELAAALKERDDARGIQSAEKKILLDEIEAHTATRTELAALQARLHSLRESAFALGLVEIPSDKFALREAALAAPAPQEEK